MQSKFNPVLFMIIVSAWLLSALAATALFGGELADEMEIRYEAATPEEAAWTDAFPLAVIEVRPTRDLTKRGEPVSLCTIIYEIVHENHPDIDTFKADDGRDVYLGGEWFEQRTLEALLRKNECPAYRHQN